MATRLEQELGIEQLSCFNVARGKKESITSPNLYSPLALIKPILYFIARGKWSHLKSYLHLTVFYALFPIYAVQEPCLFS